MKNRGREKRTVVFTIGHSTGLIPAFMEIIVASGIETVVDVRAIPKSRRNPRFIKEALTESLRGVKIE